MRIPGEEARRRVQALRTALERCSDQPEAVPFAISTGDASSPICLYVSTENIPVDLVEGFDTGITGLLEMIDNFAEQHGCAEVLDFNLKLFHLKLYAADTGFKSGVLAGASGREITRLERGLVFSLTSDRRIVKSVDSLPANHKPLGLYGARRGCSPALILDARSAQRDADYVLKPRDILERCAYCSPRAYGSSSRYH